MSEAIEGLREKIDQIDKAIVTLLLERCQVVDSIHQLKRNEGLSLKDKAREEKILLRLQALCPELNPDLIADIYEIIFSAYEDRAYQKVVPTF